MLGCPGSQSLASSFAPTSQRLPHPIPTRSPNLGVPPPSLPPGGSHSAAPESDPSSCDGSSSSSSSSSCLRRRSLPPAAVLEAGVWGRLGAPGGARVARGPAGGGDGERRAGAGQGPRRGRSPLCLGCGGDAAAAQAGWRDAGAERGGGGRREAGGEPRGGGSRGHAQRPGRGRLGLVVRGGGAQGRSWPGPQGGEAQSRGSRAHGTESGRSSPGCCGEGCGMARQELGTEMREEPGRGGVDPFTPRGGDRFYVLCVSVGALARPPLCVRVSLREALWTLEIARLTLSVAFDARNQPVAC